MTTLRCLWIIDPNNEFLWKENGWPLPVIAIFGGHDGPPPHLAQTYLARRESCARPPYPPD